MKTAEDFILYTNKHFQEEQALYNVKEEKVVLKGDYYHDKIPYKIEGYLLALEINEKDILSIAVDSEDELFTTLHFCED